MPNSNNNTIITSKSSTSYNEAKENLHNLAIHNINFNFEIGKLYYLLPIGCTAPAVVPKSLSGFLFYKGVNVDDFARKDKAENYVNFVTFSNDISRNNIISWSQTVIVLNKWIDQTNFLDRGEAPIRYINLLIGKQVVRNVDFGYAAKGKEEKYSFLKEMDLKKKFWLVPANTTYVPSEPNLSLCTETT